jgi:short-subunit dehydrogenase
MKRVLITGASRGIGRAIALRLADHDRTLLLHGRDATALDAVAAEVRERGATAETHVADLADPDAALRLADAAATDPLDVLINNAGHAVVKPLAEISLHEWQQSLNVGVTAPFLLTQRLAPHMPEGGSVVNVLSVAVRTAFPGWAAYVAAKHALDGFAAVVREELRGQGIRVINVYPAASDTEIWRAVPGEVPRERMMPPTETADAIAYALERPKTVLVDSVHVGGIWGNL